MHAEKQIGLEELSELVLQRLRREADSGYGPYEPQ